MSSAAESAGGSAIALSIAGVPLSLPVIIAAGCAVVGAGVVARDAFPALASVFAPSERTGNEDPLAPYIKTHEQLFETSQKRWEGRYVFFAPPAPKPPPPPPPPPPKPEDIKPTPIQPAPSTYGGTKPTGIFGDIVFFGSDRRVPVGEKFGEVEVLGIEPPFNVKIGWTKSGHERGEYKVSIWEYSPDLFSRPNPFPKTSLSGFKEVAGSGSAEPTDASGTKPPEGDAANSAHKPGDRTGGRPTMPSRPGSRGSDGKPGEVKPGDPRPGEVAPPATPPANEGGADESGGGPKPEAVPANQPQRRYPPGQAPKQSASEDSGQPMEPVPLEKLPPFRSESDIKAMNAQAAQQALQKINESLALKNLDDHNRARLEYDAGLIAEHLKSTK